jgi:NAD(P)-dependent dehydrogenase (short-subunit alcohol dehydrogenase family)
MKSPTSPQDYLVISANSGIGEPLALSWAAEGHRVTGSYRTLSQEDRARLSKKLTLHHLDLSDSASMIDFAERAPAWDVLVVCPGTMEPIGLLAELDIAAWRDAVSVNFLAQIELVQRLLPKRKSGGSPSVVFFAGGGTNSAPVRFSAYTVAKIALIKTVELLDAELPDTCFTILGPGWVKTRIHQEVLAAGAAAGDAYQRTLERLESGEGFTPEGRIRDFCNWVIQSPREVVGGRNFSIVHDQYGDALSTRLREDPDLYKLRRHGN